MSSSASEESLHEVGSDEVQMTHSETQNTGGSSIGSVTPKDRFKCPSDTLQIHAKGPFNPKKPLLQFATNLTGPKAKNSGGSRHWLCHICNTDYHGSYSRVEHHLLGESGHGVRICADIKLEEQVEMLKLVGESEEKHAATSSSTKRKRSLQMKSIDEHSNLSVGHGLEHKGKKKATSTTTTGEKNTVIGMMNMQKREIADDSVAKFFYAHAIPFHLAKSPYFKNMLRDAAAVGSSYVPPGVHRLRTSLLDKQYSKVNIVMEEMRQTWIRTGCSIVMDGWTDIRHRPLINIIVTCPSGSYFLRAIDCSGKRKDADFQFALLKEAIEEVGSSNVVQVVTDSARVCKLAGLMVESAYKHIFWTPCCVHALNNALKDIGKIEWVKVAVAESRSIQMFICNHQTSLALFRSYSKKEFLKPVETRYASYFILLERTLEVQDALQSMVVAREWKKWAISKTEEGQKMRDMVLNESWWSNIKYICSIISPVVRVIRYADTDSPSLGEIYETFDSMLDQMRQAIRAKDPELQFYEQHIRPIVTKRWNTMNTPLHMAAYALNPKWYAPRPGRMLPSEDDEVMEGLMAALRKMYGTEEATILREQWLQFSELQGPTFSKPEARTDRATIAQKNPIGWWKFHGKDTPELKQLAIRLLSQIASSSAAERNWSTYGFIHSIKRNRLTSKRAEKLVAVHSALRLQDRQTTEYRQTPAARWDVDPEDVRQIDEEEVQPGMVGVPLDDPLQAESGSDTDTSFDIDSPNEA